MARTPINLLAAGLLFMIPVPILSGSAEISSTTDSSVQVTVRIWDLVQVGSQTLGRAQAVVEASFEPIGVKLIWLRCEELGCSAPIGPNDISLRIFQRNRKNLRKMRHSTMGMAVPRTTERGKGIAYVFFDRVMEVTRNQGVAPELALGVAIAHEMGHLLLPGHPHALVGIMRGDLKPKDWRLAAQGQLSFTDKQRDIIADGLRARNLQRTSSHPLVNPG